MGKHLVIVGAGHAHLTVLKNLQEFKNSGHDVTVVSASQLHYYSGMGPGMLSGIYRPEEIRFNVKKLSEDRGAAFVEDKVVKVQPHERKISLQSGNEIPYDIISLNTGSFVPVAKSMTTDETVFTVKPIENLLKARRKIVEILKNKELTATVVGGGPTGVEVAGNLDRLVRDESGKCRITLVAGTRLLPQFKGSVRQRALNSLSGRNVQVIEGVRMAAVKDGSVELSDGRWCRAFRRRCFGKRYYFHGDWRQAVSTIWRFRATHRPGRRYVGQSISAVRLSSGNLWRR
jgi:NADH dehydrogenase FAD-containing subunit